MIYHAPTGIAVMDRHGMPCPYKVDFGTEDYPQVLMRLSRVGLEAGGWALAAKRLVTKFGDKWFYTPTGCAAIIAECLL